jgi:hypothetical protein
LTLRDSRAETANPVVEISRPTTITGEMRLELGYTNDLSITIKSPANAAADPTTVLTAESNDSEFAIAAEPNSQTEQLTKVLRGDSPPGATIKLTYGGSVLQQVVTESEINQLREAESASNTTMPAAADGCAEASSKLKRLGGAPASIPITDIEDPATTERIKAVKTFDSQCLGSLVPPEWPHSAPDWVRSSRPERALGLLAIRSDGRPTANVFCTALIISEAQVLTARHCFYEYELFQKDGRVDAIQKGRVVLVRPLAGAAPVIIRREATPPTDVQSYLDEQFRRGKFNSERDFLVLQLDTTIDDVPRVHFRPPRTSETVWLAGPFSLQQQLEGHEEAVAEDISASAIQLFRWTRSSACEITANDNTCVRHTCQTVGRFSGAPIFGAPQRASDDIEVVGMHLGASGIGGCAVVESKVYGAGNTGLSAASLGFRGTGWVNTEN